MGKHSIRFKNKKMEIHILRKFGSPKPWKAPSCRCSWLKNYQQDIQKENQMVNLETETKDNHDQDIENLQEALNQRDRLLRGGKLALSFENADPWSQQTNSNYFKQQQSYYYGNSAQDDPQSPNDRDRRRQYLIERISDCIIKK